MKKIIKIKATCNQCEKQMKGILELEKWTIPVCTNPSCPNFGLLQISSEKIMIAPGLPAKRDMLESMSEKPALQKADTE